MIKNSETTMMKRSNAIRERIAQHETAFKTGQLRNHSAVRSFEMDDAGGQRGWGPMMQT
jgi:hypothetical protein